MKKAYGCTGSRNHPQLQALRLLFVHTFCTSGSEGFKLPNPQQLAFVGILKLWHDGFLMQVLTNPP